MQVRPRQTPPPPQTPLLQSRVFRWLFESYTSRAWNRAQEPRHQIECEGRLSVRERWVGRRLSAGAWRSRSPAGPALPDAVALPSWLLPYHLDRPISSKHDSRHEMRLPPCASQTAHGWNRRRANQSQPKMMLTVAMSKRNFYSANGTLAFSCSLIKLMSNIDTRGRDT